MIWSKEKVSAELRSLLDRERQIAVLPAATRSRAISRARAALAAGVAARPSPSRAPLAVRWVLAAGLACVATVGAGAAAYTIGVRARPSVPPVQAVASADSDVPRPRAGDAPSPDVEPAALLEATPSRSRAGAVRVELRLLQQARAAVARQEFPLAIQLLAEHARRFKTGRLVEEREALRVRSLAGLGRRGDARRAAADFEANFPRSPLLPTVNEMLDSMP
jgi:hypothetical protein